MLQGLLYMTPNAGRDEQLLADAVASQCGLYGRRKQAGTRIHLGGTLFLTHLLQYNVCVKRLHLAPLSD